jgi:hypothetical protein
MSDNVLLAPRKTRTLRFAYASALGSRLLVLMSDRGIADVCSGDDELDLLRQARSRFPGVRLVADQGLHSCWVTAVQRRFDERIEWLASQTPLDLG